MATAMSKLDKFVLNLGKGVYDLSADTLKIALTAAANPPVKATSNQLSNLTQIVYTNCSDTTITITSFTQTSGTAKLILTDLVLTATGAVGPFRYVVIYDDTATNKELIAFYDYGSEVTLANGDTFTINFDASAGVITIA